MQDEIKQTTEWFSTERFKEITRLYSARQVVEQRGTLSQDYTVAREAASGFYKLLRKLFNEKKSITTMGPYSPGQAVMMKRHGIQGIYLGGWATSAKGSVTEDRGADLASYPLSQVPDEAATLVRALLSADKNQRFERARMSKEQQDEPMFATWFVVSLRSAFRDTTAKTRSPVPRSVVTRPVRYWFR